MYNGIGLPTPRGSGTSGYIQRNLGHVHPSRVTKKPAASKREETGSLKVKAGGDPELLEHERRRQVEVELLEYADELEGRGISGDELDEMVEARRQKLVKALEQEETSEEEDEHAKNKGSSHDKKEKEKQVKPSPKRKRNLDRDTHLRAQEKSREDERMRKALKLN